MLRLLVLVLVLANAGYWAWSNGVLADLGFTPAVQSEPQRMTTQIRPEAIVLLTAAEASKIESGGATSSAAAAAAEASECLQAGLFNEQQTAALRTALETGLPAGSWQIESAIEPGRWLVYMGKYAGEEALAKKRSELRQLGVSFRPVTNPALAPGLSLGTFASQAEADAELARVATRGVRTARVMQERAEARGQIVKLAAVDAALRTRLDVLTAPLEGKPLRSCA
ncbi:MAG TPA: SPOR domain-containing protein [Polaromonas sp.]|uniref:SPOR domain-containing protein n=1 Tax=Polaromonas sp. TaxID=1869339 RepID=UPI002D47D013|nr:SPOR domain-containing protein [Polaromonas sp.]HYW55887.1 SPOR domain-containing protein [Polaromonas sp.]